jgi:hypothetical protein
MRPTDIELIQPTLGLNPYILIESLPDEDSPAGFDLKVRAGGGFDGQDEVVALLLLLVETMTGVSTELYAQEVDIARRAARRSADDATPATEETQPS